MNGELKNAGKKCEFDHLVEAIVILFCLQTGSFCTCGPPDTYYSFYFNMDTPNSVMTSLCPQYCLQLSLTISQTALCLAGIFYNFLFDSTSSTSDWGLKFRFYTYLQLTVTYYMRNFKLIIRNNLSMQMLVKCTNE